MHPRTRAYLYTHMQCPGAFFCIRYTHWHIHMHTHVYTDARAMKHTCMNAYLLTRGHKNVHA